ncbi:MAG: carboxypeptidase-like regulatory domain-containing protein [Bacteroidota bacterium]
MKKQYSLTISVPCEQNWSDFTPTADGGFCGSCQKNVIDFTQMSDEEVLNFFKNKPKNVCGRLSQYQMTNLSQRTTSTATSAMKWVRAGLLSALMITAGHSLMAQNQPTAFPVERNEGIGVSEESNTNAALSHQIKGVVVDEFNQSLPGVNIYLKGSTTVGTVSDVDGNFTFPQRVETGDVIVFSFIGMETVEYTVPEQVPDKLTITMQSFIELTGEVVVGQVYHEKSSVFGQLWRKVKHIF